MKKNLLILFGLLFLLADVSPARHYAVNLRSANGRFVAAENGGGGAVNADRAMAGEWETFALLDLNEGELESGDPVAIKTVGGSFFSAAGGGGDKLLADRTVPAAWETFTIVRITGRTTDNLIKDRDDVVFKTMKNTFISAAAGGGREVNARPTSRTNSETFSIRLKGDPAAGKLSGPFTAPQMIIRPVVGVDDSNKTSGDIKKCKNDHLGENFPNCYRGHEGTDFGLIGHVVAQMAGSIDVYSVAAGKVVAAADGNTDLCFYKFPPPKPDSPAADFVFCINDKNDAKEANFIAVLQDDGVIAYYYHLKKDSIAVRVGERVNCGQFLGKIGSSGISSAPHLHLTLQRMKSGSTFPKTEQDFRNAGGNRSTADIINPYYPMLWAELVAQVPKKVCGESRTTARENEPKGEGESCRQTTECKFGLTCQSGKCQKISIPPPEKCGNNPPCLPGFTCSNGRCVPKRP